MNVNIGSIVCTACEYRILPSGSERSMDAMLKHFKEFHTQEPLPIGLMAMWSGRKVPVWRVIAEVGPAPHDLYWSTPFIGQPRKAVLVQASTEFLIDDEDQSGWNRVTTGLPGAPTRFLPSGSKVIDFIDKTRKMT